MKKNLFNKAFDKHPRLMLKEMQKLHRSETRIVERKLARAMALLNAAYSSAFAWHCPRCGTFDDDPGLPRPPRRQGGHRSCPPLHPGSVQVHTATLGR